MPHLIKACMDINLVYFIACILWFYQDIILQILYSISKKKYKYLGLQVRNESLLLKLYIDRNPYSDKYVILMARMTFIDFYEVH